MLNYMLQFYVAQPSENRIGDFYISSAVQVLQLFCSSLCWRPPALLQFQHLLQYQRSLLTSALWFVYAYTAITSIDNQGWSSCYLKCFDCLSICRSVSHHFPVKLLLSVAVIAVVTKVSVQFLYFKGCTSATTVLLQFLLTASSAVTAPASVTISAVATNVGALVVYAYTTITSIDNQGWSSCYLKCFYCLSICRSVSHHFHVKLLLSVAVSAVATKVSVQFLELVQTFSAATAPILQCVHFRCAMLQLYCSSLCRRPPALLLLQHLLQYQLPIDLDTQLPIELQIPIELQLRAQLRVPTASDRAP